LQTLRNREAESKVAIDVLHYNRTAALSIAPELMRICDSLETSIRCQLMFCLADTDIPARERMDFFLERADDSDPKIRGSALRGVYIALPEAGGYRRDEVIKRLMTELNDEDPAVREGAASTASDLRIVEALPVLKQLMLYDGDEKVRESAAWAVDILENRSPCSPKPAP
jgi:HEAT repeat protein